MNNDLKTYDCFQCGGKAEEVIYAERKMRVGWYCPKCSNFEKAIGRETKTEKEKA
ncbi:MAG: hypothetical protein RLZZ602_1341 [Pseudomonadota bacterium]|jgi:hypothetical protein